VAEDYRVAIPEEIRELLAIKPGDTVAWLVKHGTVKFLRVPTLDEMSGRFKGMNVEGYREEVDEERWPL
jgi:bifunctional DNA-binding transcriptional regulator/antitoxin component of YhaV-PrlF toxin-antitoxin module